MLLPFHAAHTPQLLLLHLEGGVYHFFLQLYAMFPCNFVNYLKARYGPKGEAAVFRKHIAVSVLFNTDRCHLSLVAKTSEYGVCILYEEKMGGLCLSGYFSELAFCAKCKECIQALMAAP